MDKDLFKVYCLANNHGFTVTMTDRNGIVVEYSDDKTQVLFVISHNTNNRYIVVSFNPKFKHDMMLLWAYEYALRTLRLPIGLWAYRRCMDCIESDEFFTEHNAYSKHYDTCDDRISYETLETMFTQIHPVE